ncbi:MAG: YbhB/YbcL family Raf kinase inhibitor-like protein [Acidobacteria bacterium]|nr:YbhB/YbcL family Raf kinase inhibitor-like protein [Acidobacteriota bacterium]
MAFKIRVLAFNEGEQIPKRHTCDGENLSPTIEWEDAPPGTRSFALVVDDPDAPSGVWTHWILWDIPGSEHGLAEGFLPGRIGTSGTNDFGDEGYGGPCPPKGHGPHRYFFKLYALDTSRLMLHEGSDRHGIDKGLRGHDLAEAWAMGTYERS